MDGRESAELLGDAIDDDLDHVCLSAPSPEPSRWPDLSVKKHDVVRIDGEGD